jgi:hypothetical protein
VCDPV